MYDSGFLHHARLCDVTVRVEMSVYLLTKLSVVKCILARQTAYMIVDEAHAVLPEVARDQYWDELQVQLPYTLATQQTRRDDYTATADNIESVLHQHQHNYITTSVS